MPIPVLAAVPTIIGVVGKVGGAVGGFFKKLFGGKRKRRKARLAQKQQRLEDASNRVLATTISKLEEKARIGEAKAGVKLARIQKQLARQGISFDPGVQDASLSDLGFEIPGIFRKRRNPQVFQETPQPTFDVPIVTAAVLPAKAFNLGELFKNPMVLIIGVVLAILLFMRR